MNLLFFIFVFFAMFNLCYSRYGQQPNRYVDYNNNYNQPPSNNYNNYYSGGRQQGGWGQSNNGKIGISNDLISLISNTTMEITMTTTNHNNNNPSHHPHSHKPEIANLILRFLCHLEHLELPMGIHKKISERMK
uniref:Uncharacterized protein n=1 Tax=Meloidogyne enterolobii TaxID=390850 RepID=A0A6V7UWG4_MELEN|nr:unnamed protein product [Meloidogyne enterolobii]